MCKLDLSKVLIYKLHYDYIKNKYGNKTRLLLTDNDSLTNEIEAKDTDEYFYKDKKPFYFSNYQNILIIGRIYSLVK